MVTRTKRPQNNLPKQLKVLDLLLRARSFSRWPLSIRFFAQNAWKEWEKHGRTLLFNGGKPLRSSISILLDLRLQEPDELENESVEGQKVPARRKGGQHAQNGIGGVQGLDITYGKCTLYAIQAFSLTMPTDNIQPCVQKSKELLSESSQDGFLKCMLCSLELSPPHDTTVVCPHSFCEHVSHITCLSSKFLRQEARKPSDVEGLGSHFPAPMETQILPVEGCCPGCGRLTQWIDIVKPLTYRLRVIIPEKKTRAKKAVTTSPKTEKTKKKSASTKVPKTKSATTTKATKTSRRKKVTEVQNEEVDENGDEEMVDRENNREEVGDESSDEADRENYLKAASDDDIETWLWKDPIAEYHLQREFSDVDEDEEESDDGEDGEDGEDSEGSEDGMNV